MTASAPVAECAAHAAAWGSDPGTFPLASVSLPVDRWNRAVALGGQGRYSLGTAELDALERSIPVGDMLGSLAASTRASWLRQIGRHVVAARYDGLALARCGPLRGHMSPSATSAYCDAVTGLAADALGTGRFGTAGALLARAAEALAAHEDGAQVLWRPRLRLLWVRAELAMMSGDGVSSVRHALDARSIATDTTSLRHRIKTDLIVAAAYSSVGDGDRAVAEARTVLDACSEHGLVPLRWASAMLLRGLGEVTPAQFVVAECAELLARRGGIPAGA